MTPNIFNMQVICKSSSLSVMIGVVIFRWRVSDSSSRDKSWRVENYLMTVLWQFSPSPLACRRPGFVKKKSPKWGSHEGKTPWQIKSPATNFPWWKIHLDFGTPWIPSCRRVADPISSRPGPKTSWIRQSARIGERQNNGEGKATPKVSKSAILKRCQDMYFSNICKKKHEKRVNKNMIQAFAEQWAFRKIDQWPLASVSWSLDRRCSPASYRPEAVVILSFVQFLCFKYSLCRFHLEIHLVWSKKYYISCDIKFFVQNSNLLLPNLQGGIALDVILLSPPQASQASHFLELTELLTPQKPWPKRTEKALDDNKSFAGCGWKTYTKYHLHHLFVISTLPIICIVSGYKSEVLYNNLKKLIIYMYLHTNVSKYVNHTIYYHISILRCFRHLRYLLAMPRMARSESPIHSHCSRPRDWPCQVLRGSMFGWPQNRGLLFGHKKPDVMICECFQCFQSFVGAAHSRSWINTLQYDVCQI